MIAYDEIAIELVSVLKGIGGAQSLRNQLGTRSVVVMESELEPLRTIELQVLEDRVDEMEVAAFSDGPDRTVGVNALYDRRGMRLLCDVRIFIKGVPAKRNDF